MRYCKFPIGQTRYSLKYEVTEGEGCFSYVKVSVAVAIEWVDFFSFQIYIVVAKFLIALPSFLQQTFKLLFTASNQEVEELIVHT